jgi:hypothetical protein
MTDDLLDRINAAVREATEAENSVTTAQAELVSRSKTVGLLLLEAKKRHPEVKDFKAFLKKVNGLKLSRAYDFMRLAGGRTTDEELKQDARERQRRRRDKKKKATPALPAPHSVTVTESTGDLSETATQSAHYLSEFIIACRMYLPKITLEADKQTARDLVATLLSSECREAA